jgi:NAD(P)H dehydrogenase (quinone)
MKIGVTGATGQLGKMVIDKLKQRTAAANIVALVRTPQKASDLGVEVRLFDYDKQATLADSFRGIDRLLLISANEPGRRLKQHKNVIDAAKEANLGLLVYTSLLRADKTTLVLGPEHLETEKLIIDSGIPYTILRHGWYTENYLGGLDHVISSGVVNGSAGNGKISAATREDYAEADVAALLSDEHFNKTYELAGDESFTLTDLAAAISEAAGKSVEYRNLAVNEYVEALVAAGLPQGVAQFLAGTHVPTEKGDLFDDGRQLSKLIGRNTTPLKDAITAALES